MHPLLEKWEDKLQRIFDSIDEALEEKYGSKYPLKANRPPHKKGITPDSDGLFDLGVSFTAGLGSKYGPGYVFKVKLATMQRVPSEFQEQIENEVVTHLKDKLQTVFSKKDLKVARDGTVFKVYGDLGLD